MVTLLFAKDFKTILNKVNLPILYETCIEILDPSNCWKMCLMSGHIASSSIILKRHFDGIVRCDCLKSLPMKQLSQSLSLEQVILWINLDILPSLSFYLGKQTTDSIYFKRFVIGLCTDVCTRAENSERLCGHPFDAITAMQMVLRVLQMIQEISESDALLARSPLEKSIELLRCFEIQGFIWNTWSDRTISHDLVVELGVSGLISQK